VGAEGSEEGVERPGRGVRALKGEGTGLTLLERAGVDREGEGRRPGTERMTEEVEETVVTVVTVLVVEGGEGTMGPVTVERTGTAERVRRMEGEEVKEEGGTPVSVRRNDEGEGTTEEVISLTLPPPLTGWRKG
jgi:hypothetical protein